MSRKVRDTNGDKLEIEEFQLSSMCDSPSIVMVAKRGSGKSWVARAILDHFSDIPVGMIIAPTDRMNCFYGNFFPSTYIFYEYKTKIIENIIARQILIIKKQKEKRAEGKYIDARAFIIMDDCLGDKKSWVNDKPIQELLFNGRHYRIMYILTMQFPLGITPELRNNFDYVFLLADDIITNLKRIYDHYAGIFPDFGSFRQVFAHLTADFGSMVLNNRGARSSFLEKLQWYKAPDLSKTYIKYGCAQFRRFHYKNFDPTWEDKQQLFDINEYFAKKKKSKVRLNVRKVEKEDKKKDTDNQ